MRRTGRTTRMLQEAITRARQGEDIFVVGASYQHADDMVRQIQHLLCACGAPVWGAPWRYNKKSMKFVIVGGSITLYSLSGATQFLTGEFDWFRMQFKGRPATVLVDHYAIEKQFAQVLEMLHRWDALGEPMSDKPVGAESGGGVRGIR